MDTNDFIKSNKDETLPVKRLPAGVEAKQVVDEMRSSFIDYAMSVIISRALPDVRDGLKPVHRRILFSMQDLNLHYNRPYVKCSRVVGDALAKYHPHGNNAVYDALVRLAQEWNLRYPLVDGQGNFGSVEGDPPAAFRYTECRLQKIAAHLLNDLDKETVDFAPNFDGKEREPVVLPALIPNLLINGASGIAVGMATNIPPHNLNEVLEGAIALARNPELSIDDLMQYIPGPDFPTYGVIYGRGGIKQAYHTGRGLVVMRAKATFEELKNDRTQIVITEVPYQVNPNRVLERIAELVSDKKIEGISGLRNESSREGMRLVVELKKDAMPQVVLNHLYNQTSLQSSFGIIMLAIVDGRPKVLTLKSVLQHFLEHRKEVVSRRTRFELKKAQERQEIVEGLSLAIDNIDRIISIIRAAMDPEEAKANLLVEPLHGLEAFLRRAGRSSEEIETRTKNNVAYLTEPQVKAILDMRLQRLTGLERDKLFQEYMQLTAEIDELTAILSSEERLREVIIGELETIKKDFSDKRRTLIVEEEGSISLEELIKEEPTVVTLSKNGYIRRASLSEYRSQQRGGKGIIGAVMNKEDLIMRLFCASTHDHVLLITNKGRMYSKRVFELPEGARATKGKAIVNFLPLQEAEKVVEMLPIHEFVPDAFVLFATRRGVIKKTELQAFSAIRVSGIIALALDEGDSIVGARITQGQSDIALCTKEGRVARFSEGKLRSLSRIARGVRGIRLKSKDEVVSLEVVHRELPMTLFTVCEHGYGKRTPTLDYPVKGRGIGGVITIKTSKRNGYVVGVRVVQDDDEVILATHLGKVIRIKVSGIPTQGRNTQGVRLIRLTEDDVLVAMGVFNLKQLGLTEVDLDAEKEALDATSQIETLSGAEELDDEDLQEDAEDVEGEEDAE